MLEENAAAIIHHPPTTGGLRVAVATMAPRGGSRQDQGHTGAGLVPLLPEGLGESTGG